jgi:hypothetical protein
MLRSPHADVPLFRRSIFSHLLGTTPDAPHFVGGFPASSPAFIDAATGAVLTRGALRSYALQFAYSLHNLPAPLAHQPHPTAPPTVLIFSPNNIVWPVLLHGVAAAGFRATLANSAYIPTELAYQYVDAGAHLIFAHPTLVPVVQDTLKALGCTESEIRSRLVLVTSHSLTGVPDPVSADFAHLVRLDTFFGRGALPKEVSFDGERSNETLYLCYSSGTTGNPKGVETTHYNLVSVTEILRPVFPSTTPCLAPSLPGDTKGPRPDVVFGPLPYYHIYGAIQLLLFPLSLGTPAVVMAGFDPVQFCQAVERYRATILLVVPPMLVVLARHAGEFLSFESLTSSSSFDSCRKVQYDFNAHDLLGCCAPGGRPRSDHKKASPKSRCRRRRQSGCGHPPATPPTTLTHPPCVVSIWPHGDFPVAHVITPGRRQHAHRFRWSRASQPSGATGPRRCGRGEHVTFVPIGVDQRSLIHACRVVL